MGSNVFAAPDRTHVPDPAHIELYRDLADHQGLEPTRQMLSYVKGAGALAALYRYAPQRWTLFREAVHRRYPGVAEWTSTRAKDGRVLASVPERATYEVLCRVLPPDVHLEIHPTCFGRCKADFGLRAGGKVAYAEVLGFLGRGDQPDSFVGQKYQRAAARKLTAYAAHGFSPIVIYLSDVCDPDLLAALISRAIDQVRGRL